jgi:hypothetical protein
LTVLPLIPGDVLYPIDDAVADWSDKSKNFGNATTMTIKTAPVYVQATAGFDVQRPVFRFDLSGLPKNAVVRKAEFYCYVVDHNNTVHFPVGVCTTGNAWNEDTLTWLTKFPLLPNSWKYDWRSEVCVATHYVPPQNGPQVWDFTDFVKSKFPCDTLSFFLYKYKTSHTWIKIGSKDTVHYVPRPILNLFLDYSVKNETAGIISFEAGITVKPNPFNPACVAEIRLPVNTVSKASLCVFSTDGRKVLDLTPSIVWKDACKGSALWSASALPCGMYVLKLKAGGRSWQKKAVLLR